MDRAMTVDAEELVAAYETSRVALGCLDKSPLSSTGRDLLRIKSYAKNRNMSSECELH